MTIAFDAATVFDMTSTNSTTHTPAGTPRGVVVMGTMGAGSANEITSITYGGVTVPLQVESTTSTAHAYFLGASIPTGAQTVAIGSSGSSAKRIVIVTVTAATDTSVEASDQFTNAATTTPSITLTTGVETWITGALHSGNDDPSTVNGGASYTVVSERDFGTSTGAYQRITSNAAAGSPVCDWSQSNDFGRAVAVAVREVASAAGTVLDPFGMSGFFGS